MKKIITFIIVCILIAGAFVGYFKGFKVGLVYKKSISFYAYVGEKLEDNDIKEIAKKVFDGQDIMVQKVEVYEDMISITTGEMKNKKIENAKELLASTINEKYGTELKADSIGVIHNPKTKITDVAKKYIAPFIMVTVLVLVYQAIRFRKLGVLKTLGITIGSIIIVESTFLSLMAIIRLPINRLTIPIGVALLIGTIIIGNMYNESKLENVKK